MIAQKSMKSKIFHRPECRFINRIEEQSLLTFEFDEKSKSDLKPCKCCCTLKALYNNFMENHKNIFAGLPISTEFDGEYVKIHTEWYDWRIGLENSSQNIKLYREIWNEEKKKNDLVKWDALEKSKNISAAMHYVANEERVAVYPVAYRKQALQIKSYALENQIQIEYDDEDLYILTDIAAWKISYNYYLDRYKLLHCPFDGHSLTIEEAKSARYHVQTDVAKNKSPYKHLQYIVKHDEARKIELVDYKNLPRKTRKEKKYYRQASNRARRKSIDNVLNILAELEAKGEVSRNVSG